MKPETEDWRLTAYVLGELSPEDAAKIEYAVASDPAVRLAVQGTERAQARIADALGNGSETLLPRQKNAIMRAAREAARGDEIKPLKSHRQVLRIWSWPLAAAAVVAAGMFLITLIPAPEGGGNANSAASSNRNADGSLVSPERGQNSTPLRLTLESGNKSLAVIARGIRRDKSLPEKEEVKIEEMLNAFPLNAKRAVALWQGCSLGAEILNCPWNPSAKLVFLKVRGSRNSSHRIALEYQSGEVIELGDKPAGFQSSGESAESKPVERKMEPGEDVFLALLIERDDEAFGRLFWTVDGESAPALELKEHADKAASKDARFAALVCGFGLWLRQEESSRIDDTVLLAMAREVASESLVADRYDFLELVDQAVRLDKK
jgi:hypothetical protein